ncbi:CK001 protein, partial [Polyodon spathula]|nr:CK001 protein [Polyodon spathula]
MRATGHDWGDSDKFQQYGWRCTKKEDACSTRTLIGNWNEEQHDLHSLAQRKPLPSQYSHYFGTIYSASYDKGRKEPAIRGRFLFSFDFALNEVEIVQH